MFHRNIEFELVDRREWSIGSGKRIVEFSFPSILGQSRSAYKKFIDYLEDKEWYRECRVRYGREPCDPEL